MTPLIICALYDHPTIREAATIGGFDLGQKRLRFVQGGHHRTPIGGIQVGAEYLQVFN